MRDGQYFYEDESNVMKLGYRMRSVLCRCTTSCGQRVLIFDSAAFGKTLVIDGMVQSSEKTEFLYNEIMAHMALDCLREVSDVLIVGGGSGLTVKQVLKYPSLRHVTLCDITDEIMKLCKEYIPNYVSSLDNEKVNVVIADGANYVKLHKGCYDGILVDCCDPIGSAACLFSKEFYRDCIDALSEKGMLCIQTGSPLFRPGCDEYHNLLHAIKGLDVVYRPVVFTCPMIVGGFYMFVLITKNRQVSWEASHHIRRSDVKYYNPDNRESYFDIPPFIKDMLAGNPDERSQNSEKM